MGPSVTAEGEGGADGAVFAVRRAPGLSAKGLSEPRTALQRSDAETEGHKDAPRRGLEPPTARPSRAAQPLPAEQLPQPPGPPLGPPPAFVAGRAAGGQRRGLHGDFGLRPPRAAGGARRQGPLCCAARGSARGRHTKATAPLRALRAAGEWGGNTRSSAAAPLVPPQTPKPAPLVGARGGPGFPWGRVGAATSQPHGGAGRALRVGRGCGSASGSGGLRCAGRAAEGWVRKGPPQPRPWGRRREPGPPSALGRAEGCREGGSGAQCPGGAAAPLLRRRLARPSALIRGQSARCPRVGPGRAGRLPSRGAALSTQSWVHARAHV